ncbi:MAG: tRNA (guanosine(37)-N1)-methyltransferase TrmD [Chloroflexota bacterium]
MKVDILSLFPEMFPPYLDESILKRAQAADHVQIAVHDIRQYGLGRHRITDEPPYGGGGGMILRPDPIFDSIEAIVAGEQEAGATQPRIILLSPQGRLFTQDVAAELSAESHLILICGRYEGVDERVREHLVTDELSIGDYVLTGGELAAMVVVDAVTRLLPGVLGAEGAAAEDSHATGLLEGPHYTHPEVYRVWPVPEVLLSGHAANIERWRREAALRRTWERRPDLLLTADLTEDDKRFLLTIMEEQIEGNTYER